jgi:opacity protein-like surface antigen
MDLKRCGMGLAASLALLLSASAARAGDIWVGPLGNSAWSTRSDADVDTGRGFGGGLTCELELNERFSLALQPGLVSRRTEGHVAGSGGGANVCICFGSLCFCSGGQAREPYDFEQTFRSIDAPVLGKMRLRKEGFSPYLLAGPRIGLLTSAKVTRTSASSVNTDDLKEDTRGVDFGFIGGAGIELPLGKARRSKLFVEGQYDLGLVGQWKDDDTPNKARAFLVKLGVAFNFSKSSR